MTTFTVTVRWSAEDEEFVATCAEEPLLSWLASSEWEAVAGLTRLVFAGH